MLASLRPTSPRAAFPAITALLFGAGLFLLLGAAVVTPRRAPVPRIAMPLYEHRVDLAVVGAGAIALALLWFNIKVLL
jgi:hypothetical protein